MKKTTTIDEYLSNLEPERREALEHIRTLVKQIVPDADETMSYNMPTLKYKDRPLVYFTSSKKHMSFYPSAWTIEELKDELKGYQTTAHAIQFTPNNLLSDQLIKNLVLIHKREIDANRQ